MSSRKKASVLIVEDNVSLATCLEMLLEANSYEVCRTADGLGGLRSIKLMDFDVILCDVVMPGLCGDDLHAAVAQVKPHLCDRFIFMTGIPDKEKSTELATRTQRPIFCKPFALASLLEAIQAVVQANAASRNKAPSSDVHAVGA